MLNGELKDNQATRIYAVNGKSTTLSANGGGWGAKTGLYAIPVEFEGDTPTNATSEANGKTYPVFEVKDGLITINGRQCTIKLPDGFYIIRKLTVRECMRLQTVPEWYEFPVSDSQAYKMLGNGWTCRVIEHLLRGCMAALDQPAPEKEPKRVVVKRINKQEE
jgi:DNA (cytosine-5)-methyltransferase 3A